MDWTRGMDVYLRFCETKFESEFQEDEEVMQSLMGTVSQDAIQERVYAAAALRAGEKKILFKADVVGGEGHAYLI